MRGEVGFVIILGIILVGIIVILYTSGIFPHPLDQPPTNLKQEQKIVWDYIVNIIREGAVKNIKILENQGGYIGNLPADSPKSGLTLTKVPFWVKCGNFTPPTLNEIENTLSSLIKSHLRESLDKVTILFGKNVSFDLDKITARVNIMDSKIDFSIDFPVKVSGELIRATYTASIPTKFGRIYKFASDFSEEIAKERHFEAFTIQAIYASELRPSGLLVGCNNYFIKKPEEISEDLEDIVYYVVKTIEANLFNEKKINTKSPNFGIKTVNGKKYTDLKIFMNLPKNFNIISTDSIVAIPKVIQPEDVDIPVSECAIYYDYNFSVNYPVIVSVQDDVIDPTGNPFNFAILVDVDKKEKGDCELQKSVGEEDLTKFVRLHKVPKLTFRFLEERDGQIVPIDNEKILVDIAYSEKRKYVVSNSRDFDMRNCIKEKYPEYLNAYDIANNKNLKNIDENTRNQYIKGVQGCMTDNLLNQVEVDYIPSGKYTISISLLSNPRKVANENFKKYPFLAMPLESTRTQITLPEENSEIRIIVPNSDEIYNKAKRIVDRERLNCWKVRGLFHSRTKCEPEETRWARGLEKAIKFIEKKFELKIG